MSGELTGVIIVGTVFFSIVQIVRIVAESRLRHKLLEMENVDENTKKLFSSLERHNVPSSLKWGMVLIAVGAAIWIAQLFPYSYQDEAIVSTMLIMGGLALIVYYFVAGKISNDN